MSQRFRKSRKRRRFRPLRRLLLLVVLGLLTYAVVYAGLWAYKAVFVPKIQVVQAELVPEQVSFSGRAVVVRDEVVVVATRGGTLNRLSEGDGPFQVKAGQPIFELVDTPLLAAIDKKLAEEEKKYSDRALLSDDYIANKVAQLNSALGEFFSLAERYRILLRQKDTALANTVFRELERASRNIDKLHNEYEHVSRSLGQFETVQAELLEQRKAATFTVSSPLDGLASFRIDSLGEELRPSKISSIGLEFLSQVKENVVLLTDGVTIAPGQLVCAIIDPTVMYLLLEAGGGLRLEIESAFELQVQGELLNASFVNKMPTADENTFIYVYAVKDAPPALLQNRIVTAEFRSLSVKAVSIPKKAIVTVDGVARVYGLGSNGLVEEYLVTVRDVKGSQAIVLGLIPGQEIVSTPGLVKLGDPFDNPGGGH